ncbi:uncharacterized protein LOC142976266 [Anticarsia gemmatalis]|uniref:uncharacterized protein LOC142976266 n=1 Tax=Anticarsia gemmatalis TaxID=129554 RepID=UPI003F76143E
MSVMIVESVTSIQQIEEFIPLMTAKDRTNCKLVSYVIIMQCILIFIGAASVIACVWTPDVATLDYDKLVRIMYLFDSQACGYKLTMSKKLANLQFNNSTKGFKDIRPIQWQKAVNLFSTELAANTRVNIELSLILHCVWFFIAIVSHIFCQRSYNLKHMKTILAVLFYSSVIMIILDVSLALVYISHIKQSLSKSMILRYSGWSNTLKLNSYDDFAGWLPIVASICWARGIIILFVNAYCCKIVNTVRKKIMRREIKMKYDENEQYSIIPDPDSAFVTDYGLLYRKDEKIPYIKITPK